MSSMSQVSNEFTISSKSGRKPDAVRTQFVLHEDDNTKVKCVHCSRCVSSVVRTLRNHLRGCEAFLRKNDETKQDTDEWLLAPQFYEKISTVSSKTSTLTVEEVDKYGFQVHVSDMKISKKIHSGTITLQELLDEFYTPCGTRIRRMQKAFVNMLAYHNLPFEFANSPFLAEFVRSINPLAAKFIPTGATCRKILIKQIEECETLIQDVAKTAKSTGESINVSVDSWLSVSNDSLLGIVLTCKDIMYPDSLQLAADSETGLELARIIEEWILKFENKLAPSRISSLVTDNAGPCRKARKYLAIRFPSICFMPCMAHQANLIVKDVVKIFDYKKMERVKDFVKHVRTSKKLRNCLVNLCTSLYGGEHTYTLQRMTELRWNSAHSCLCSILRVRTAISALASYALNQLGKRKASDTVFHWILGDSSFFEYCENLEKALRPLVSFSLLMQSTTKCMAHAFNCLLNVYDAFCETEGENFKLDLLKKLEARWNSYEQPLFIISYFLHPEYMQTGIEMFEVLDAENLLVGGTLAQFIIVYFKKYIPESFSPTDLEEEVFDILRGDFFTDIEHYKLRNPLNFWKFSRAKKLNLLKKLATFFITLTINSASCERLFSLFGLIKTKRRNRLSPKYVKKLAQRKKFLEQKVWQKKRSKVSRIPSSSEWTLLNQNAPQGFLALPTIGEEEDDNMEDGGNDINPEDHNLASGSDTVSLQDSIWEQRLFESDEEIEMESFQDVETGKEDFVQFNENVFSGKFYRDTQGVIVEQSEKEKLEGTRSFKIKLQHLHSAWKKARAGKHKG